MKTFFMCLGLVCIIVICVVSGSQYLKGNHNTSALLTVCWVISIGAWFKSNGFLKDKEPIENGLVEPIEIQQPS